MLLRQPASCAQASPALQPCYDRAAAYKFASQRALCRSLPRVGIHLALPQRMSRAEWYGKGPHECYPDRKTGAWLRRHSAAHAAELHVPYIFPGTPCLLAAVVLR